MKGFTDLDKRSLDRWLTTDPDESRHAFLDNVVDKYSDQFCHIINDLYDFEDCDIEHRWIDRLYWKNVEGIYNSMTDDQMYIHCARVIERAFMRYLMHDIVQDDPMLEPYCQKCNTYESFLKLNDKFIIGGGS